MNDIRISFTDKKNLFLSNARFVMQRKLKFLQEDKIHCGNKTLMDQQNGTEFLKARVESGTPFLVGRFGSFECSVVNKYLLKQIYNKISYSNLLDYMCNNAGFFPRDEKYLDEYAKLMLPLYSEIDLLCRMYTIGEDFIIKRFCPNTELTVFSAVEPAISQWTSMLEDKKVLVIHPFEESIRNQYFNNREKLYVGTNILPKFDLQTVKAVQTSAGAKDERFNDWFEALDYMTEEVLNKDFDIALVGCGAYGLPLGARIKQNGKMAFNLGGCIQLLFGIRGARWDTREYMKPFINEYWTRPLESETPEQAKKVENACYW